MDEVRISGWRNLSCGSVCSCDDEKEMKFDKSVKEAIWNRAKDRCEICGTMALYNQIHHRRPRGMGGSKDPLCGSAANGILVHPSCHAQIESNRSEAYENGWLVYQGHDPAYVPFKKYFGWVLLNHDGTMSASSKEVI